MESVYLKTLIEVAKSGNLTKASQALHVTQSAVSRRIKFLEGQYGKTLLDRSGPVLKLTSAGHLVLDKAQKILDIEKELFSGLSQLEKEKKIVFSCTPTFGIAHLPHILQEYMLLNSDASDLQFHFDMPDGIVKGLNEGVYDLAIIEHCQCFNLSDFEMTALPGDEMIFAGAQSLGIKSSTLDISELFPYTLFGRHEGCCSRTLLEANLNNVGEKIDNFKRIVIYDDLHIIIRSLQNGDGVAFISNDLVSEDISNGILSGYHVNGFTHKRKRTMVVSGNLSEAPRLNRFAECIFNYFELTRQNNQKSGETSSSISSGHKHQQTQIMIGF